LQRRLPGAFEKAHELYGWVFGSKVGHNSNDRKTIRVSSSRLTKKPTLSQARINKGQVSLEFRSFFVIKNENIPGGESVIAKNLPVHHGHHFSTAPPNLLSKSSVQISCCSLGSQPAILTSKIMIKLK
jgi:hypothetical protein